jgi:hypothetical protein
MLCRTKATFKFKYANGRAIMYYQVASVEQKQELDIQLNGMHVEFAQITISAWSEVLRLYLPRKHLLENEYNKVSFINTTNYNDSKAEEPWAVQLLGIEEQPLPSPDKAKAEEAFKNAEEQYKNKDVALGNPYQALQNFRRARDYLELIPEDQRPEFYQEATDKIDMIEMELEKRFRQLMFQAEQKKKYRRFKEAAEIYGQIMQSFKNQEDPHWQAAKEALDEILPPG